MMESYLGNNEVGIWVEKRPLVRRTLGIISLQVWLSFQGWTNAELELLKSGQKPLRRLIASRVEIQADSHLKAVMGNNLALRFAVKQLPSRDQVVEHNKRL